MKCLLCDNDAVQDGLCVPDGAKLWAATEWANFPEDARIYQQMVQTLDVVNPDHVERAIAIVNSVRSPVEAHEFLATFHAAKAKQVAEQPGCKECGRLVPRDEHKPTCSMVST